MIVTGKHLPRRTFLKGLGVAVALPMLDAMTPAFAAAAVKRAPTRLAFTYIPNGVTMEAWTPAASGARLRIPAHPEAAREPTARRRWCSAAWRSRTRTRSATAPATTRARRPVT